MVSQNIRDIHNFITGIKQSLLNAKFDDVNKILTFQTIRWLLQQGLFVFSKDEILVKTHGPIHVCGDIHGQYKDLINIFDRLGYPSNNNRYLFLGDYVDRGEKSIEVFCLLLCYKLLYPHDVFLLRGNHECSSISRIYGFYDECKRKYNIKLWKLFTDVFNYMPICAVIGYPNEEPVMMCMHGGISPNLKDLRAIDKIKRPTEIPDEGTLCDLLWSDPDNEMFRNGWNESDRGVSYTFGKDVLRVFMKINGLDLIVRGHQVVEDGYEFFGERSLLTIFSAPRYCGEFDNYGGVLSLSKDLVCKISIFK